MSVSARLAPGGAVDRPSGAILGRYRLIAEIGQGGMSHVYLALAQGPAGVQKLVVVKERRSDPSDDAELHSMFVDECRLAARLSHPNVVQTFEVGEEADRYYIAMEYLEGQPLHRVRSRVADGLPLVAHLRILADALAGLDYAHDLTDFDGTPLHVVHRDVSPQNVFVTYDGVTKLVDFGIAKAASSSSETKTGVLKGKVPYMAPEQARGGKVDRRVDVFAVGVLLWEAVARQRMWRGVSEIGVLSRLLEGDIPKLRGVAPAVDDGLLRVVETALAHNPNDRYATALEMQQDIENYLLNAGLRVSSRTVQQLMTEHFGPARAEMRRVVDDHVRNLRASSVELARIDLERPAATPSGVRAPDPYADRKTGEVTAASPLRDAGPIAPEPGGVASAQPTVAVPRASVEADTARPRWVGAVVVTSLAAGATLAVATQWPGAPALVDAVRTSEPSAPPSRSEHDGAPPTQSQTVRLAASVVSQVWLRVQGVPAHAVVSLDGAAVGKGPVAVQAPRDAAVHVLRVEAEGYRPVEEKVTTDSDLTLRLSMKPAAGGTAPLQATSVPTAAPTAPASTGDDLVLPKRSKPTKIDTENPY